jgi:hypothetical protein
MNDPPPNSTGAATRQEELCLALRALLRPLHLEHLWTAAGPTQEAMHIRRTLGHPLNGAARVLVLAAFDVWDQKGGALFGEIIHLLEVEHLVRLFALAIAVKADDDETLNHWLEQHHPGVTPRHTRVR